MISVKYNYLFSTEIYQKNKLTNFPYFKIWKFSTSSISYKLIYFQHKLRFTKLALARDASPNLIPTAYGQQGDFAKQCSPTYVQRGFYYITCLAVQQFSVLLLKVLNGFLILLLQHFYQLKYRKESRVFEIVFVFRHSVFLTKSNADRPIEV